MGLKGRFQGLVTTRSHGKHLPKEGVEGNAVFLHPGDYGKNKAGQWGVYPPAAARPGAPFVAGVLPAGYKVTEHADGTITVHGPPFETSLGPLRLIRGHWEHATDVDPNSIPPELRPTELVVESPPVEAAPASVSADTQVVTFEAGDGSGSAP